MCFNRRSCGFIVSNSFLLLLVRHLLLLAMHLFLIVFLLLLVRHLLLLAMHLFLIAFLLLAISCRYFTFPLYLPIISASAILRPVSYLLATSSDLRGLPTPRALLATLGNKDAIRNKCIASSKRCLTSSNKKLLETSASLVISNKCHATRSKDATLVHSEDPVPAISSARGFHESTASGSAVFYRLNSDVVFCQDL